MTRRRSTPMILLPGFFNAVDDFVKEAKVLGVPSDAADSLLGVLCQGYGGAIEVLIYPSPSTPTP